MIIFNLFSQERNTENKRKQKADGNKKPIEINNPNNPNNPNNLEQPKERKVIKCLKYRTQQAHSTSPTI